MTEWQPIETAPKDGTPILGGHSHAVFTCYWEGGGHLNSTGMAAWVDGSVDRWGEYCTFEPTHWMPLPSPPKTEAAE